MLYLNNSKTYLLDVYTVAERTGLRYAAALALVRVNGVRIGRRYYMTEDALIGALNRQGREERDG